MGFLGFGKKKKELIKGKDIYRIEDDTKLKITGKGINYMGEINELSHEYDDDRAQIIFAFAAENKAIKVRDISENSGVDLPKTKAIVRNYVRLGFVEVV
jgi:hypothetical protein